MTSFLAKLSREIHTHKPEPGHFWFKLNLGAPVYLFQSRAWGSQEIDYFPLGCQCVLRSVSTRATKENTIVIEEWSKSLLGTPEYQIVLSIEKPLIVQCRSCKFAWLLITEAMVKHEGEKINENVKV